ncbi:hypothetical protein ABC382_01110 [Lysinibacillus sp. 1P01SD]|uniref:hypothetical protein n=1 Tax=Lysinibacillus sp. 1P01SD TaxID=3132285 RepID=UPI0039A1C141
MGVRMSYKNENKVIKFGLDQINGVFMQIFENDEPTSNWSEFSHFQFPFTYDSIQDGIKKGLISKGDFTELCKIPIGDFKVYFRDIGTTEDVSDDFQFPQSLIKHLYSGKGYRVRKMGDYYKLLKLFRIPVSFGTVTWYENNNSSSRTMIEFRNDFANQFVF